MANLDSSFSSCDSLDDGGLSIPCNCRVCQRKRSGLGIMTGACRIDNCAAYHFDIHSELIKQSPSTTLVVGPKKLTITCQTFLLSYFSEYFDIILYNGLEVVDGSKVSHKEKVFLPEFDFNEMSAFVSWLNTGRIDRSERYNSDNGLWACSLWMLGDKLGAPAFCNRVMYLLSDTYYCESLAASEAALVYENTKPESQLRLFMTEIIKCKGPFSKHAQVDSAYQQEWVELLRKGGDLVADIVVHGFDKFNVSTVPWEEKNLHKYYVKELERPFPSAWRVVKLGLFAQKDGNFDSSELEEEVGRLKPKNLKRPFEKIEDQTSAQETGCSD